MSGTLPTRLLTNGELRRSSVDANCRMNREGNLAGSNGEGKSIGFDPLHGRKRRNSEGRPAAWLDLYCGSGKALIEVARIVHDRVPGVEIVGVDPVGMFLRRGPDLMCRRLVESSPNAWRPGRSFDLISCVQGLHYVGDNPR